MARMTWESEREAAILAARRAGDVLAQWAGRFTTRTKGQNDLVTEADLAAQEAIRETLLRKFPSDDFLGEEETADPSTLRSSRRWIVDPIDGTSNFVHGFPAYCVSIALAVDDELAVGVVLDPSRKECFAAARGQGATCNGGRIHVSASARMSEGLVCVGLPAVPDKYPEAIQALVTFTAKARSMRRIGSAALSLAYVAAGRSDAFLSHAIQPWDVAAGAILVQEAGGCVSNLRSDRHNLYTRDILATNGLVHEEVRQLLESGG